VASGTKTFATNVGGGSEVWIGGDADNLDGLVFIGQLRGTAKVYAGAMTGAEYAAS
jgi:hypothetical protein